MDSRLFLEFLRHFDKKPRTIRPRIRKDLFDHFDDEEFKKRFRLTKSTVTKLLEQVGIPADCAAPQSFLFLSIFLYFTLLLQHQRAGICSFTTSAINDVTNYVIGLGEGRPSL